MSGLIDLFFESDYVGMATPVYGLFMTSILKKFNERLLPTATPHIHKNEDGSCYHEERMHYPRFFMIANSGFPGEHNFDLFKAYTASQNPVLEVYRNSGGILEDCPDESVKKRINEFYGALREAGKEMVIKGQVSEEISKSIHAELISDDEFMAGANQYWDEEIAKGEP
jgi:multimeric flavodoxin WrbA